MNTKLTLTIEQSTIEKAKTYAKSKGRSLSDIVENYFKMITNEDDTINSEESPITDSMIGAFKAPEDFDYKKELTEAIMNKHNINEKNFNRF